MASAPERSRGLPPVVRRAGGDRVSARSRLATAAAPCRPCSWREPPRSRRSIDATFNPVNRLVLLAAVLASAALFAARQFRLASPSMVLRLGSGVAGRGRLRPRPGRDDAARGAAGPALGISAVGPWILIVSGLVPNRPRRALMAALAAATAWPIAYAVNAARGMAAIQSDVWLLWPLLNYAMAGLAYFLGRATEGAGDRTESSDDLGGYHLESRIGEGGHGRSLEGQSQAAGAVGRREDHPPGRRGPGEPGGRHGGGAVQARGQRDREAAVAAHRLPLRLRRRERRALLLRDGAAGRHQPAGAGRRVRPAGARPGGAGAVPDVRVAPRGARARPGAPRSEAVERHGVRGGVHASTS